MNGNDSKKSGSSFSGSHSEPLLVHLRFDAAAAQYPNNTAIIFGSEAISYRDLLYRANSLASDLAQSGVLPGDRVALLLPRSPESIVAILGILKAGAGYVPLDPSYPKDRLSYMLTNAAPHTLIVGDEFRELLPAGPWKILSSTGLKRELPSFSTVSPTSRSTAYILYTSGSTGTPKGVAMGHGAVANLIQWQISQPGFSTPSRTIQFSPLSFDVSFQEIFSTLSTGGALILITEDDRIDAARLLRVIRQQRCDRLFLPFVALQALADAITRGESPPVSLKEIITAGEQLQITPQIRALFDKTPGCRLHNHYGPTESHVVTALTLSGKPSDWPMLPSIGTPILNSNVRIVDDAGSEVRDGESGELLLEGSCLAEGYFNKPDLTAERFVSLRFGDSLPVRVYRTGDLGRRIGGVIEYLGRKDSQVKIRGFRVELGEIEVALGTFPGVTLGIVAVREDTPGDKRLAAYYSTDTGESLPASQLRAHLASRLPEFMLPGHYLLVKEFPRTPSGKIDRKALPKPANTRPEISTPLTPPRNSTELKLLQIWETVLGIEGIGSEDNFFEIGGNSLLVVRCVAEARRHFPQISVSLFFKNPTVRGIAHGLTQSDTRSAVAEAPSITRDNTRTVAHDIAIIGMSARVPGASNISELWKLLIEGREGVSFFDPSEIDPLVPSEIRSSPQYVRARGILPNAGAFDPAFFGISPREADVIDPQQRIFLELSWEALESAGYVPEKFSGRIGVFGGVGNNTYHHVNVLTRPEIVEALGQFQVMVGNEKDYVATRVAHKLSLRGPAVSIHTACSTSLVAVCEAVENLRAGRCDMAIAGGASITSPQKSGYLYQEGGMFSRDGHTKAFDADGSGTVFSDGAGCVILRPLADAIAAGDTIYGVITGIGLNNDGGAKASFTAPSVDGQAAVITQALRDAGVSAESLSYVETHGTGTPLGDPVEVAGLTEAFRAHTTKVGFCSIGSVKTNIGHLTAAAGVVGLIKTALSLHFKKLPPSLHFTRPNPSIDFANSPFTVHSSLTEWNAPHRRAGVSSFGVGGTNAHVIVEEAPGDHPVSPERQTDLFLLSAKSEGQVDSIATSLISALSPPGISRTDAAYTLHTGRRAFPVRRAILVDRESDLTRALSQPLSGDITRGMLSTKHSGVALLFPGQGSQYDAMGRGLYREFTVFRGALDECLEITDSRLPRPLRELLLTNVPTTEAPLAQTLYTQPALFSVEYALAQQWLSWGIEPTMMIGHSVGEFVAATIAGIFSLSDALNLVISRAELMQSLPRGTMLSVRCSEEVANSYLTGSLALAAINSPSLCVVSGPVDEITALEGRLHGDKIPCKQLHTSHAFHSPMVEPAVAPFRELLQRVTLKSPLLPIISTKTGRLLSENEARNPHYWASHMRDTVRFSSAIETAVAQGDLCFLECGPRGSLSTLAKQTRPQTNTVQSLNDSSSDRIEERAILKAVGSLWVRGIEVPAERFYSQEERRRIPLPTYPFARTEHWLTPGSTPAPLPATTRALVENATTLSEELPMTTTIASQTISALRASFEEQSGLDLAAVPPTTSFVEMGLDSLFLTQAALDIQRTYGVKLAFRQLLEEYSSFETLAQYIDSSRPQTGPVAAPHCQVAETTVRAQPVPSHLAPTLLDGSVAGIISAQLQIISQQLNMLTGGNFTLSIDAPSITSPSPVATKPLPIPETPPEPPVKPFGAQARITRSKGAPLTPKQQAFLDTLIARYTSRTRRSKAHIQNYRSYLADPRVVSGFKPALKEIIYPIVVDRSQGARLTDIDGNEYIDLTCGFGSNFFGNQAPFIVDALKKQIDSGIEIGPMTPLAGEVARLVCDLTGHDRAALCNTGSEAVLGVMRLARTVTGRNKIAVFNGSYHGIFDEVIVRPGKNLRSYAASPGIPPSAVENIVVLDYGTPESLNYLREHVSEFGAIMVEPVQSRHPDVQPKEFLQELRRITEPVGTALIFDEVITGFRVHPAGAQGYFGITADIASYGKVAGAGMPVGIIAGKKRFMDALDGGSWQFGDDSIPEVGVTYFAGTFVRFPLALAATKVALQYLKDHGPEVQKTLNHRTDQLVSELQKFVEDLGVPVAIKHFGSLFKIVCDENTLYGELLFHLLRERGIHAWDQRPCFLTLAHSDNDIQIIAKAFKDSVRELQAGGIYPEQPNRKQGAESLSAENPPVPGARLGRDRNGKPAWFVPDPERPGKFIQVGEIQ